eukprot:jgi/Botrbrau1/21828/Bobra.0190s0043.1
MQYPGSPAGVLLVVNHLDEKVYMDRLIFGHHSELAKFVKSVRPQTPCFLYRIHTQELWGVMATRGRGGLNLDPDIFPSKLGPGSDFPAQIRVQGGCNFEEPLRGKIVFNIIGQNLGYRGEPFDAFKLRRRNVLHGLTQEQVNALMHELRLRNEPLPPLQPVPDVLPSLMRYVTQSSQPLQQRRVSDASGAAYSPPRLPGPLSPHQLDSAPVYAGQRSSAGNVHRSVYQSGIRGPVAGPASSDWMPPLPGASSPPLPTNSLGSSEDPWARRWSDRSLLLPFRDPQGSPQSMASGVPLLETGDRVPGGAFVSFNQASHGQALHPHMSARERTAAPAPSPVGPDPIAASSSAVTPGAEPPQRIVRQGRRKARVSILWGAQGRSEDVLSQRSPTTEFMQFAVRDSNLVDDAMYGGSLWSLMSASVRDLQNPFYTPGWCVDMLTEEQLEELEEDPVTCTLEVDLGLPEPFEVWLPALLDALSDVPEPRPEQRSEQRPAFPTRGHTSPPPLPPSQAPLPGWEGAMHSYDALQGALPHLMGAGPQQMLPLRASSAGAPPAIEPPGGFYECAPMQFPVGLEAAGFPYSQAGLPMPATSGAQRLATQVQKGGNAALKRVVALTQPLGSLAPEQAQAATGVPKQRAVAWLGAPVDPRAEASAVMVSNIPTVKLRYKEVLGDLERFLEQEGLLDVPDFLYLYDSVQKPPGVQGKLTIHPRDERDGPRLAERLQHWAPCMANAPLEVTVLKGVTLATLLGRHGHRAVKLRDAPSAYALGGIGPEPLHTLPMPLVFFQGRAADPVHVARKAGIEERPLRTGHAARTWQASQPRRGEPQAHEPPWTPAQKVSPLAPPRRAIPVGVSAGPSKGAGVGKKRPADVPLPRTDVNGAKPEGGLKKPRRPPIIYKDPALEDLGAVDAKPVYKWTPQPLRGLSAATTLAQEAPRDGATKLKRAPIVYKDPEKAGLGNGPLKATPLQPPSWSKRLGGPDRQGGPASRALDQETAARKGIMLGKPANGVAGAKVTEGPGGSGPAGDGVRRLEGAAGGVAPLTPEVDGHHPAGVTPSLEGDKEQERGGCSNSLLDQEEGELLLDPPSLQTQDSELGDFVSLTSA